MRKFIFAIVTLLLSVQLQAQQPYASWLSLGIGKAAVFSPSPGNITQVHSLWHHLISGRHDIILSGNLGWNNNLFFAPDQLFFQTVTAVSYGQRTQVSKHLFFTPAVGVGVCRQTMTHFYSTTGDFEDALIASLFNRSQDTETYASYRERNLCIPVSLNFLYTTRFAGLEGGLEFMISKRPVAGARLCFSFGKMYRKAG
jgi:hypothetical protein